MKFFLFIFFIGLRWISIAQVAESETYIRLAGNAYVVSGEQEAKITDRGLEDWTGDQAVVSVFFAVPAAGVYSLSLKAKGESRIKVVCGKKSYVVNLSAPAYRNIPVGKMRVADSGYVRIDFCPVEKKGKTFGEIEGIFLNGSSGNWVYVRDFSDYWGRRGPSVHLNYKMPDQPVEWFYNELLVPAEGEARGCYYMANGFAEGYFGIQYNSETERRILFSVWSPYHTSDPGKVPEDERVRLLRKGKGVYTGEFGDEGTGGQSYLKYNWKAGVTYPFLMQVYPDGKGNTVYTAYFYATEEEKWLLIASFLRPKTDTWYKFAYSFIENFIPEQGYLPRKGIFKNQWVRTSEGVWQEIVQAGFSFDATARAGVRKDYQGGLDGDEEFYLRNGGFFEDPTPYGMILIRKATHEPPLINFERLKRL